MNTAEFVPSDTQIKAFKEWVQSRDSKPYIWDAGRWFQSSQLIDDIPEASLHPVLGPLIDEAIEDALKAAEERNKVLLSRVSGLCYYWPKDPSPNNASFAVN